jgi:hypothetical protein
LPAFLYQTFRHLCNDVITVVFSVTFVLGVKIIDLIDRIYLFKISNVVLRGKEIVTSLYSSIEGQRQRERERERERENQ